MTAYGTIEGAVEAIKGGAYDYLTKPFQPEELILAVNPSVEGEGCYTAGVGIYYFENSSPKEKQS